MPATLHHANMRGRDRGGTVSRAMALAALTLAAKPHTTSSWSVVCRIPTQPATWVGGLDLRNTGDTNLAVLPCRSGSDMGTVSSHLKSLVAPHGVLASRHPQTGSRPHAARQIAYFTTRTSAGAGGQSGRRTWRLRQAAGGSQGPAILNADVEGQRQQPTNARAHRPACGAPDGRGRDR